MTMSQASPKLLTGRSSGEKTGSTTSSVTPKTS